MFTYQCSCPKIFQVNPTADTGRARRVLSPDVTYSVSGQQPASLKLLTWSTGTSLPRIPPGPGRVLSLSAGQVRSVRKLMLLEVISITEKWELGVQTPSFLTLHCANSAICSTQSPRGTQKSSTHPLQAFPLPVSTLSLTVLPWKTSINYLNPNSFTSGDPNQKY